MDFIQVTPYTWVPSTSITAVNVIAEISCTELTVKDAPNPLSGKPGNYINHYITPYILRGAGGVVASQLKVSWVSWSFIAAYYLYRHSIIDEFPLPLWITEDFEEKYKEAIGDALTEIESRFKGGI